MIVNNNHKPDFSNIGVKKLVRCTKQIQFRLV
jgi:hypothetical protein